MHARLLTRRRSRADLRNYQNAHRSLFVRFVGVIDPRTPCLLDVFRPSFIDHQMYPRLFGDADDSRTAPPYHCH